MLGNLSRDAAVFRQLRDVDDGDGSACGSDAGLQPPTTQTRTIEQLAMGKAFLREAAARRLERWKPET
ncbi:hypothetical protein MMC06_003129 [Schaereria dolodes]|nr:hypothetical protein [Schaereria dolodes]